MHDSIIRPGLEAVSALSWVLVLKAPLSSRYGRQATLLNLLKGSKLPMPLLLEREGIQHLKLDKLLIEENRGRYRDFDTLLLKPSLSSHSLSAKDHIININLL